VNKLLIANRGEIACRIAATAGKMGIRTVAIFSEHDRGARHVLACDEAVMLDPQMARSTYLNISGIVSTALDVGADAVHPGYGFLAENADFASACQENGLIFVGPSAKAIHLMGDKARAKAFAASVNMPTIPGFDGLNLSDGALFSLAEEIGYPIMLKATKGGGGRGLRIVRDPADFTAALGSCRREAVAGFGDGALMIEKYLFEPRHIEVQILADRHGNVVHLFDRDCSIQRRHQKVIEEAPALSVSHATRAEMTRAAIDLVKAIDYEGVGTIECIQTSDGKYYFLEMNTRLQVEHGITELVTGIDLIEWQLRVARGEAIGFTQADVDIQGHSIEARICAERPKKSFFSSAGAIDVFDLPEHVEFGFGDVRIDSGVRCHDIITPHYDSMIAKVMVRAETRELACKKMNLTLSAIRISGVETNLDFLRNIFRNDSFRLGEFHTGFIEQNLSALLDK
jgi:3-methylcrotonyl-CoA carboxylase alpha subunit